MVPAIPDFFFVFFWYSVWVGSRNPCSLHRASQISARESVAILPCSLLADGSYSIPFCGQVGPQELRPLFLFFERYRDTIIRSCPLKLRIVISAAWSSSWIPNLVREPNIKSCKSRVDGRRRDWFLNLATGGRRDANLNRVICPWKWKALTDNPKGLTWWMLCFLPLFHH